MTRRTGPKYPHVQVNLCGGSGNAFAIISSVRTAMRKARVAPEEIEAFTNEAKSGDYDNVLTTCFRWVEVL